MFNPEKVGLEYPCKFYFISAVVQLLANSLSKVDIDLRNTLYNEIVLAGGNTMMDGFPERLIK
jgi:centractin